MEKERFSFARAEERKIDIQRTDVILSGGRQPGVEDLPPSDEGGGP